MKNKFLVIACLGASCFTVANVGSQTVPPVPQESSVNAVIVSNSGRQRRLTSENGYVGRAGLRPRQAVRVGLEFPATLAGGSVLVFSPDGGEILGPEAPKIKTDGTASFVFQAGTQHGLYRVFVEVVGQRHLFEFYVMDTDNPGNNPPRVKIVD